MSRLSLPKRPPGQPSKFGALGVPRSGTGATAQQQPGATGATGGGATGGSPARRPPAPALFDGCSSSSDDELVPRSRGPQQENRQPWQQHGSTRLPASKPARSAPSTTPAPAPASSSQPPTSQRSGNPVSELYDIYDSSSAEEEASDGRAQAPPQAAEQHPQLAAQHPQPCPICGSRLQGLSLEQRQQHVNACCDDTAGGHGSRPPPQRRQAPPKQQGSEAAAFHRPCYQQHQQPPPPQQQPQQQQSCRQQQQPAPARGKHELAEQHAAAATRAVAPPCTLQQQLAVQHLPPPPVPALAPQRQQPPPPQAQAPPRCKVCSADLSHLGLQEQVTHVKACLGGRGRGGRPAKQAAAAAALLKAAQQKAAPLPPPPPAQETVVDRLQRMDIGEWLKTLGLQQYAITFAKQELDLTCLHVVTADELSEIGVTDRLHQARIVQAAAAVALQLRLRRPRAAGGGGGDQPAAAKRQKQLTMGGCMVAAAAEQQGAAPSGFQQQQGDVSMRDAGPRPQERALLAALYPPQPAVAAAAQQAAHQQRTPQLLGGRSVARFAPASASLWAGSATCQAVAPLLEARMARREAEDPAAAAAKRQPLARGGATAPPNEEGRALKLQWLEALREELRSQEATVAQLRGMVGQLEAELGLAPAGGGGGRG